MGLFPNIATNSISNKEIVSTLKRLEEENKELRQRQFVSELRFVNLENRVNVHEATLITRNGLTKNASAPVLPTINALDNYTNSPIQPSDFSRNGLTKNASAPVLPTINEFDNYTNSPIQPSNFSSSIDEVQPADPNKSRENLNKSFSTEFKDMLPTIKYTRNADVKSELSKHPKGAITDFTSMAIINTRLQKELKRKVSRPVGRSK